MNLKPVSQNEKDSSHEQRKRANIADEDGISDVILIGYGDFYSGPRIAYKDFTGVCL